MIGVDDNRGRIVPVQALECIDQRPHQLQAALGLGEIGRHFVQAEGYVAVGGHRIGLAALVIQIRRMRQDQMHEMILASGRPAGLAFQKAVEPPHRVDGVPVQRSGRSNTYGLCEREAVRLRFVVRSVEMVRPVQERAESSRQDGLKPQIDQSRLARGQACRGNLSVAGGGKVWTEVSVIRENVDANRRVVQIAKEPSIGERTVPPVFDGLIWVVVLPEKNGRQGEMRLGVRGLEWP